MTTTPTAEELRSVLEYDALTGILLWKQRTPSHYIGYKYPPEWMANNYNSRFAGNEAFKSVDRYGYKYGTVLGKKHKAHRVCYAIYHGMWPKGQIDHLNGVRDDNRIENLRDVSLEENSRNHKLRSTNSSGRIGVTLHKGSGMWRATIGYNGTKLNLGEFKNFEDAVSVRHDAELRLEYHANHGRVV